MEDARTVLDAAGSREAVVLGMSGGGTVAFLFAATYPARTRALILYGASARYLYADDYPIGTPLESVERICSFIESNWGTGVLFGALCPSAKSNPTLRSEYARFQRLSASPDAAAAYLWDLQPMDVRAALPHVAAPTLLLRATRDHTDPVERLATWPIASPAPASSNSIAKIT